MTTPTGETMATAVCCFCGQTKKLGEFHRYLRGKDRRTYVSRKDGKYTRLNIQTLCKICARFKRQRDKYIAYARLHGHDGLIARIERTRRLLHEQESALKKVLDSNYVKPRTLEDTQ